MSSFYHSPWLIMTFSQDWNGTLGFYQKLIWTIILKFLSAYYIFKIYGLIWKLYAGWCHKNGVLLLVYDYMPNGSLDNHIFCEEGTSTTPLSWNLRYKILSGVASALNYLLNEYDQTVVHRDLNVHWNQRLALCCLL